MKTILSIAVLGTAALAQAPGANWSTNAAATNPPLRRENPGAANATHMFLFGGRSGASGGLVRNDLWQFDGTTWTQLTANGATGSPPARVQAGVTWDFGRGRLVVFGGFSASSMVLNDTWEFNVSNSTWTNVTPSGTSPSARRFTALTFDPQTGRTLMFGGLSGSGAHLNDTWTWDGTNWVQLNPTGAQPSVRRQHHLVTRLDSADVLLFGGQDATISGSGKWRLDTWRWTGTAWSQIMTTTRPNAQVANDAAYDLIRKRVVLTGGNGIGGSPVGTTAEFDSRTNSWVNRPLDSGIFKTSRYFAAYIPATGKTYKASGQALNSTRPPTRTYEYQADDIAAISTGSPGCQTSAGVPDLEAPGLPWLGTTMELDVRNVPTGAPTVIVLGGTTTSVTFSSLGIGAANCILTVQPVAVFPAPVKSSTGRPTFAAPIPNDPSLSGQTFLTQAVVVTGATASISNRGDVVIGTL